MKHKRVKFAQKSLVNLISVFVLAVNEIVEEKRVIVNKKGRALAGDVIF